MARKYSLKIPKELSGDDSFLDFVDGLFTELNLAPEMAQLAADRWSAYTHKRVTTEAAAIERQVDGLRQTWGKDFDANVTAGKRAAKSLGLSNEDLSLLEMQSGFGPVMNMFARIGGSFTPAAGDKPGEDKITVLDPDAARARIKALESDPEFVKSIFDKRHASHDANVRLREQLYAQAHPAPDAPATTTTPTPAKPVASTPAPKLGREAALAKLAEMQADKGILDSVFNASHPQHAVNKAAWMQVQEEAHAPEGTA